MSDDDSGSRLLTLVGVVLVAFIAFQLVVVALVFLNPPDERAAEAPATTWRVERVNETHVRIVHAGGETVDSANLTVTVNGFQRRASWPDRVGEGDGSAVLADPGGRVRLYWTGGEGDRDILAQWDV